METTGEGTWPGSTFSDGGIIFSLVYSLVSTAEFVSGIKIWRTIAFLNASLGESSSGSVSSLKDGFVTATVQH